MKTILAAFAALLIAVSGAEAQQITGNGCRSGTSLAIECTANGGATGGAYRTRLTLGVPLPSSMANWQVSAELSSGPCGQSLPTMGRAAATPLTTSTALNAPPISVAPGWCFKATIHCSEGTRPSPCQAILPFRPNVILTSR